MVSARAKKIDWQPYIYLIYLGMLLFQPIFSDAGPIDWVWTGVLVAAFLPVYLYSYYKRGWVAAAAIGWMAVLGTVSLGVPLNTGGAVFFVYGAAAAPMIWSPKVAIRLILALMALTVVLFVISPIPDPFRWAVFLPGFIFVPLIGGVQIFEAEKMRANRKLRRAHDEIERIAAVAERERIARDLHDLLGHTLSVIRVKSELASRLIDRDPERARGEIEDVERTAREALAEVRAAVQGYRTSGFTGEVASAKLALEASDVVFSYHADPVALPPRLEAAFAFVLREAVTNVVRHARATRCSASLTVEDDELVLRVQDNGVGSESVEGNGLGSLRERLRALGGSVELSRGDPDGFHLEARALLPGAAAVEERPTPTLPPGGALEVS
jgi:two-component system sensor histidine kinase DesK